MVLHMQQGNKMQKMKRCTKCKKIKPLTEFYKDKNAKDGHMCRCKVCRDEATKNYQKAHPEKIKSISKKCREKNPEKYRSDSKNWREENPEKFKASVKNWRKNNPEKIKDYEAKSRAKGQVKKNWGSFKEFEDYDSYMEYLRKQSP